jgi:hypothetical protein
MLAERRTCRLCRKDGWAVDADGDRWLFRYSIRSYAHPRCLVQRRGFHSAKSLIPAHQQEDFALVYKVECETDPWNDDAAATERS